MSKRVQDELVRRELKLELLPAAQELLAKEGYDRQFGARPLRRATPTRSTGHRRPRPG